MINRPYYMNELLKFKDKSFIKVISGIRRCGKSTLLKMYANQLREMGISDSQILEFNFESAKYHHITNSNELLTEINSRITNQHTYLLFDEIQIVKNWEKAINSLQVDTDTDIYITGSNAFLLSSELATLISGRYVEIKMYPLSFKEFLDFYTFPTTISLERRFQYYLRFGGMPVLAEFNQDQTMINQAIEGIYSTVILKDVVDRNPIQNIETLKKVVRFLADNIGNIVSINRITNVLANEGTLDKNSKPSHRIIDQYISVLESAYIFYGIQRYDIKGKEYLKTLNKYYIVDLGFRNMLLGYRDADRGHILENIVFIELLRRKYRVSIGKIKDLEIDFIAETPSEKIYIQVSETILGEETRKRELAPLLNVKDNYEKWILTMDHSFEETYEGIKFINILDFLLQ